MKRFLNDSVVFFGMAIIVGGLTFGLLDSSVFGATWFKDCINIGPCPAPPGGANCSIGALANQTCVMCALQLPRWECQWTAANIQCTGTAGTGLCGTRTLGKCLGPGQACMPIGPAGTCNSPGCASGPIV